VSWPPETTPSPASGPGRPSGEDQGPHQPAPGTDEGPSRYPAPGHYPAPGQYPPAGQYAGPNGSAGADHYGTGAQYPPAPQWSQPYGTGEPAYGTGRLLAPGTFSEAPPRDPRLRLWPPSRREWRTALGVILALVAAGAAVAPLWVQLAPRLAFRVDQPGRALPVVPEAEEYVAADGRFVFITLVLGVLAALGCWLVRRSRGPWVMLALAVGGLLGAIVTWRLGMRIGTGYHQEDLQVVGTVLYQPLTLRARAALVVEPAAAVIVYLLAVGFSARNDLGRDDETAPSSGSA
jgi:hypothetical protein